VRPGADDTSADDTSAGRHAARPAADAQAAAPRAADAQAAEVVLPDVPAVSQARRVAGVLVLILVLAAAGYAVYRDRHSFADTIRRVGVGATIASFAAGLAAIAATYPIWRQVLRGLGVTLPLAPGARVFFTSQLGKYLPGSVWPVLLQMEAARVYGAKRRTVLAGNLITIVLSCSVGLTVACVVLPLSDAHALARYWWVLFALPFLLALLHPRAMPALLDRLFGLLHRPPLGERLQPLAVAQAAAWSTVSWLAQGLQLWILCAAVGHSSLSVLLLCIGGTALGVSAGVLFIPAPAGLGPREAVLILVLRPVLGAGSALAIVVASRVLLVAVDLVLAAAVLTIPSNRRATSRVASRADSQAGRRPGGAVDGE
jgi:uncharacterized membrane protein YbhN (UPF0104 family)